MQSVKLSQPKLFMILMLAIAIMLVNFSTAGAWSSTSGKAYFKDKNKSYMYADIWLGNGQSFGVKGSTWFVQKGTKKNTKIKNTTTVTVSGVGVTISGLGVNTGGKTVSKSLTNTKGQTWAGISGQLRVSNNLYFKITGTSDGTVWYDGTVRFAATSVDKWY